MRAGGPDSEKEGAQRAGSWCGEERAVRVAVVRVVCWTLSFYALFGRFQKYTVYFFTKIIGFFCPLGPFRTDIKCKLLTFEFCFHFWGVWGFWVSDFRFQMN